MRSILAATVLMALLLLLPACEPAPAAEGARGTMSLVETLGGADTVGYERALAPPELAFPGDHGPHPGFRTEWWYVTGNLTSEDGRDFGFQFTIFRSALAPELRNGTSAWGTNQAFMGHFTLTDIDRGAFWAYERFSRGAQGLAGAEREPLSVWIEDWALEGAVAGGLDDPEGLERTEGPEDTEDSVFPLHLVAAADDVSIDLHLLEGKPMVLQGDRGLSQKGAEEGNASIYYSLTRLPAIGAVTVGEERLRVTGLAWMDREWSTSALSDGQVGWDWFALQLDDGWDLMIYQLRRADGTADPLSDGVLVDPEGGKVELAWGTDVIMEPVGTWSSPTDGATYPSGWRIRVPARGWDLTVEPVLEAQELDLAFRYWEGAVRTRGIGEGGRDVAGRGYVELTGYAGGA